MTLWALAPKPCLFTRSWNYLGKKLEKSRKLVKSQLIFLANGIPRCDFFTTDEDDDGNDYKLRLMFTKWFYG